MEEEIVEDSDKEGDKIWSLTAIIQLGRLNEYHRDWGANVCEIGKLKCLILNTDKLNDSIKQNVPSFDISSSGFD